MTSGLANRMPLRSADFQFKNVFGHKIRQNSPLCSNMLFASPEVVHRPRSHCPLHFNKGNIQQIHTGKYNANARRLLSAAVPEHLCHKCDYEGTVT